MSRTVRCTPATRAGRTRKADQFADAAAVVAELANAADDVADAYVTLLVHAGIAAADVLCCTRLGEHAVGENHHEAVGLLAKVDRKLAEDLRTLLGMKTKAGYSHQPASRTDRVQAERACNRLIRAMNDLPPGAVNPAASRSSPW